MEGTLDAARLRDLEPAQAIKELKRIEGIGEFSADLILIRGVGSPNVFPGNEPRRHRAMAERYGLHDPREQDLAEIAEIAEAWRPRRSWASYLLRCIATAWPDYTAGNAVPLIRSHAVNRALEAVGACAASWVSAGARW